MEFRKGAWWRPFVFLALLVAAAPVRPCDFAADLPQQDVRVVHVIDGDTVILSDGRHLRLAGINTPETAKPERAAEAHAGAAHKALQALVEQADNALVLASNGGRDRHRRWLGYLLDAQGRSLGGQLVSQGLAQWVAVPPELSHLPCYIELERQAEAQQLGVWRDASGQPKPGFGLLQGLLKVDRDDPMRAKLGTVQVRVPNYTRHYFPQGLLPWGNRQVRLRGWKSRIGQELRLHLTHPANLEIRENSP